MKKTILSMLAFSVFAVSVSAQTTIFTENFDSGNTNGWQIFNANADNYTWEFTDQTLTENGYSTLSSPAIVSLSYAPPFVTGGYPDYIYPNDWAISPAIDLTAYSGQEITLEWTCITSTLHPDEMYRVYVSQTPDPAYIEANALVTANFVGGGGSISVPMVINAAAGKTVYVSFRHYGNGGKNYLAIDDVEIHTGAPYPLPAVAAADLDYCTGFESDAETEGWFNPRTTVDKWAVVPSYDEGHWTPTEIITDDWGNTNPVSPCTDYSDCLHSFVSKVVDYSRLRDAWLMSRGMNLEADKEVEISFWYRGYRGKKEHLQLYVGTDNNDISSFTTQLADIDNIMITDENASPETAWYEKAVYTFTPTEAGVYYLGFHDVSDPTPIVNYAWQIHIDDVCVSYKPAATDDVKAAAGALFQIGNNPVNDVLNLKTSYRLNLLSAKITVTDMSGKVVKNLKYNSAVSVSDLASGVYMLTVSDGRSSETKKFIKK